MGAVSLKTNRPGHINEPPNTLGDHIRKRRAQLAITQEHAAALARVSSFTLINWETGRTTPSIRHWPSVIGFLGYDPLPTPDTVAGRLFALRRRRGLPKGALARQLGIDPGTLHRWEAGTAVPVGRFASLLEFVLDRDSRQGLDEASQSAAVPALPENVGPLLATARRKRGLTQEAAARELEVSAPTFSRWERGQTRPARSFAAQIIGFLGYEPRAPDGVSVRSFPDRF